MRAGPAFPNSPEAAIADLPATTAAAGREAAPSAGSFRRRRLGEAIPNPENRKQVARRPRVGLDLPADVLDVSVDSALVRLEGHAAHRIQQLRAGEHAARLARQGREQLKLGLGQIHPPAAKARLHPGQVERNLGAYTDLRLPWPSALH